MYIAELGRKRDSLQTGLADSCWKHGLILETTVVNVRTTCFSIHILSIFTRTV